ncbi:MAG: hypothetical protein JWO93_2835 [Micrococcaceae bacterium]|nr:hypothetical protein [Micrococcaceae bacterium]
MKSIALANGHVSVRLPGAPRASNGGGTPAYCRQGIVAQIVSDLRTGRGVVLVGAEGTGKTFLARRATEQLSADYLLVQVRGSSIAATMPYGAIRYLLNELDDVSDHPLAVLRGLTRLLRERAAGRPILLFVDDAQDLDALAALVVAQLALAADVRLLVVCDDLTQSSGDLLQLWRDGVLRRIDVGQLTPDEAAEWFQLTYGSSISRAASDALWEASGGHPRYLEALTPVQMNAHALVEQDGVWVLSGRPFRYQGAGLDTLQTAAGSGSADERAVLDILALSGGLTLDQLLQVVPAAAIDRLERSHTLMMGVGSQPRVRLASRLIMHVLRRQVRTGRSRELYAAVRAAVGEGMLTAATQVSLATWALDCGVGLSGEEALSAARLALEMGNPAEGLRLVTSAGAGTDEAGFLDIAVVEARALLALGDRTGAATVLQRHRPSNATGPLRTTSEWTVLQASLLTAQTGTTNESVPLLIAVRSRLAQAVAGPQESAQELGAAKEEVDLALAHQALYAGRYRDAAEELAALYATARSPQRRMLAGRWLCQAWTLLGKSGDAARLAEEIQLHDAASADVTPETGPRLDWAATGVFFAHSTEHPGLVPGQGTAAGSFPGVRAGAAQELAAGLLNAYCGRAEDALAQLRPAISQLKQLNSEGELGAALAAAGFASALLGRTGDALEFLASGDERKPSSHLIASVRSYFAVLASAEMGSRSQAAGKMARLAEAERGTCAPLLELMFLAAAVRLGTNRLAGRLRTVAAGMQGELARASSLYAQGLQEQDATLLLTAASAASAMHDDLFARDAARAAMKRAEETTDRFTMRAAQQQVRTSLRRLGSVLPSDEDGQALTEREQEVAVLAASGASNRAIAAAMNISIRTVEGHLYQIYAKLQVTNRAELKTTFA